MSLGALLVDLSKLLDEPDKNADAIYRLLEKNQDLVEYEVARFFVAKHLAGDLSTRLRSVDPKERLEGVRMVALVCPRNLAAKLLRSVVKDPDSTTRKHARSVVKKLGIVDVALADARFPIPRRIGPYTPGAFNPSGWAFGIYRRNTSDAARPDVLRARGIPALASRDELASLLGVTEWSALAPGSAYIEFEVPKATGGTRRIAAPRKPLRIVQRKILDQILAKVPVHRAAHGFVPGRSTVTNAEPHLGAAIVIKMDLVDFFPSIHYRRVTGLFQELGYSAPIAADLAGLCTYRPKLAGGRRVWPGLLPQGAPTSPAITNLICRRLDARLTALAAKAGAIYTRYADDLTFSFAKDPAEALKLGRFFWWIDQICQQEGFTENTKKRRVFRRSAQQRVTGIVVNEHLAVPRDARRRFRAILSNVKKNGLEAEARGNPDLEAWLRGFAAYVQMVQPALGQRLAREAQEVLEAGSA
ncbi:MAG: reverse transcriptase family protein [Labilithrix sp.]